MAITPFSVELKEKDEFLQDLGHRIDNIYNKLKGKING